MNKRMERINKEIEKRYLRERVARLQRELQDWPMSEKRRAEKRAELRATRVELLGVVAK
jgi:50S ribosomal subunit-associated GTPase HflX